MSRIDRKVRGTVRFELCGACPESVLNACAMQALELMDLESLDACTLRVTVFENRAEEFQALARRFILLIHRSQTPFSFSSIGTYTARSTLLRSVFSIALFPHFVNCPAPCGRHRLTRGTCGAPPPAGRGRAG